MSSAGTVNGRGFVISYSVQSNPTYQNFAYGGFTVTIDTVVANQSAGQSGTGSTKSDSHKFFTSNLVCFDGFIIGIFFGTEWMF